MSETWPIAKLGECCDILDSFRVPLNAEERDNIQGDVPYYGANGLQGYIDKFIFDEPLILLAEDGGYFDEYESRPIAYRISGKSWVNNHAHILRAKSGGSFCQDFIFYCLQHKNITPFIKGGTRAKLNQAELREIVIPQAPRSTQCRIAKILSTLDRTIEQTEALIAKYQQIKAGLMHDLFTRGVTSDGKLRPAREEAPQLYKESSLGWIPKEWDEKSLGESFTLQRGFDITQDQQSEGDVPVVSSSGITSFHSTAMCPGPGVVIGRKGKLGDAYYLPGPHWPHDTSLWVKDFHGNDPRFARLFLQWMRLERFDAATSVPTLNRNFIHPLRVAIPKKAEQQEIVTRLEAFEMLIQDTRQQLEKLRMIKHGLMYDLLTGRVRVKVADSRAMENDQ